MTYSIPNFPLTDNGRQFGSRFFEDLLGLPGCRTTDKKAYHLKTTGQTERYHKAVVERWFQYTNEHQFRGDLLVQLHSYTYRWSVQGSTGMTPCSPLFTHELPSPTLEDLPTALLHDASQPVPTRLRLHILLWLLLMHTKTDKTQGGTDVIQTVLLISGYTIFQLSAQPTIYRSTSPNIENHSGTNRRWAAIESPAKILRLNVNCTRHFAFKHDQRGRYIEHDNNRQSDTCSKPEGGPQFVIWYVALESTTIHPIWGHRYQK